MVRKHFWWVLCVLMLLSVTAISWRPAAASNTVENKKEAQQQKKYLSNM